MNGQWPFFVANLMLFCYDGLAPKPEPSLRIGRKAIGPVRGVHDLPRYSRVCRTERLGEFSIARLRSKMNSLFCKHILALILLGLLGLGTSRPAITDDDILLGITWDDSLLVSFDPNTETITQVHGQLNPHEAFRGLTYDPNHNKLYALSQLGNNLYSIDPVTLDIVHIGNLHIDKRASYADAGALAYDPVTDTLYTAIEHWESGYTNLWSELCKVGIDNAEITRIGRIAGLFVTSFSYNGVDGQIYGLAVSGAGSWDSPYKSQVVRIDPGNAATEILFETPYHTMMGFAKKPGENTNIYYSWINWTSHFYGEINIDTEAINSLGNSDPVGVISAVVYRDFDVESMPLPLEEIPISFTFTGRITEVWDPNNLLSGAINVGDNFSGQFSYDINAPYKDPDPNLSAPYGVSATINTITFGAEGFRVNVRNNYYDHIDNDVRDQFCFFGLTPYGDIYWKLSDSSGAILSNDTVLPTSFDLTSWDENLFGVSERDGSYYVRGVVNTVNRGLDGGGAGFGAGKGGGGGGCFIASAAYGSYMAKDVKILGKLRDKYLLTSYLGRTLVSLYYKNSPELANLIAKRPILQSVTRIGLRPLVGATRLLIHTDDGKL
ncbi:MAG: CFI-box-CTERM domain-containing protein [Candidatus Hodarchaeota archaeon]